MTSLKYLYAGIKIGSYTSHIIHIAWETTTSESVASGKMHIAWETKTKTPASGKMLDHDLAPTHRPTRLRSRTSPTHRPAQTSHTHDHTTSTPTRLRSRTSHIAPIHHPATSPDTDMIIQVLQLYLQPLSIAVFW